MGAQYFCNNQQRRIAVRDRRNDGGDPIVNGIDYLEVSDDQLTLEVHFIHNLPGSPDAVPPSASEVSIDNVTIEGGVRVQDVGVVSVASAGDVLTVMVDKAGDYSMYILRIHDAADESAPLSGFDAQLSAVDFSFKVDCPTDFDCKPDQECPPELLAAPQINYLSKDYASFRRLMFDRLSVIMPDWHERNPADVGVMLVELLAYAGDYLSYYQDAVATEAYLGTARKRVSVRRHARLLDYPMHDGCNARVWVVFDVGPGADGGVLPGPAADRPGAMLLTLVNAPRGRMSAVEAAKQLNQAEIFETMHDVTLRQAHNTIEFYTWGDERCCLPKGGTRASLRVKNEGGLIDLQAGDLLLFEEVRGPESGLPQDADPGHRHVVRLTRVATKTDPLYQEEDDPTQDMRVLDIEWHEDDALPFPLCLWTVADASDPDRFYPVSVARGNVALADYGLTISGEALPDPSQNGARYRPILKSGPVTQQGHARDRLGQPVRTDDDRPATFDPGASAAAAMRWQMRDVLPAVRLRQTNTGAVWWPQRDLLGSDRFANEFVVESDEEGRAHLRFGDGVSGRRPVSDLVATYRIGNGQAGNVGAESIAHVVSDAVSDILDVRNPIPASGGVDPEPVEQVKLYAPQAFRTQERAVTEADYALAAQRHPDVQRAAATRRWTGSWYTMFVTVDRKGGRSVDEAFELEMRAFLDRFRLAGYDLEIDAPRFAPLDFVIKACVQPGFRRSAVRQALLEALSNRVLPDGRLGFFHPDNYTFGQPVYLSQVVATAMSVQGVERVQVLKFQRWGEAAHGELDEGRIEFNRLEIARLDNDPSAPENGKIEFLLEGGL